MAWKYRIDNFADDGLRLSFGFTVLNDGVPVISDTLYIQSDVIRNIASDGRKEYVKAELAKAASKYAVIKSVKTDFSTLVGKDFLIADPVFKTQAEIDAKNVVPVEPTGEIT